MKEKREKEVDRLIRQIREPEKGIGSDLFEAIIKVVPQPCVEAVVVNSINLPREIYLVWRNDQFYSGWHCPGTFIRFAEDFETALQRLLLREIKTEFRRFRPTDVQYSRKDSRGHTVGTVWLVEPDSKPRNGRWFPIAKLPRRILPHHREFLTRVFK
jgi:ADP-ribose pyrophosphatase YjhB (NUDIX family)